MKIKNTFVLALTATLILSSCSLGRKRHQRGKTERPTAIEQLDAKTSLVPPPSVEELTAKEDVVTSTETANEALNKIAREVATSHHRPDGVAADKALGWLKNGNIRYLKANYRSDGKSGKDRERLYKGQHPHSIVLSCSDSRVPPEHVFDQALGEVFVIRVAGEALDSSVVASIEYAVEHLGVNNILVMGHTKCGAVDASLKTAVGTSAGSADLDHLLADIRPRLTKLSREPASQDLYRESFQNAKGVAQDLVKRSALVRNFIESGKVKISSSIYNINTGIVDFEN
jgi:carbonic anhydrase